MTVIFRLNFTFLPCNQTSAGSEMKPPNLNTKDVMMCCLVRAVTLSVEQWWSERNPDPIPFHTLQIFNEIT